MKNLGENILKFRKEKKLSQEKLAEMMNVSRQTVASWEANITSLDINQAKKLSEIFEIGLDELGGVDVRKNVLIKLKETERLTNIIWKLLIVICCFQIIILVIGNLNKRNDTNFQHADMYCKLNGETFLIEYIYSHDDLKLIKLGTLEKYVNELNLRDYVYTYDLVRDVESYVESNNGICIEVKS